VESVSLFRDDPGVRRLSLVRLSGEIARSVAGIGRVAVEGEVVRPSSHPGGTYFTLRDRTAQVSVRCPAARLARCRVVAGERVLVTAAPVWLNDRGQLQLVAEEVSPVGAGAIAALLAEVRGRLVADGLCDRPRRPLPRLPRVIGVICGSEAAVRADIDSVVAARFPGYPVLYAETNVSGPGAADALARAVQALDQRTDVEVMVLARGGGDAAQLLPFSDEALCRAIARCRTPVVSAVGHEGDRPLCDDVADARFGTPSLAAAAVVPSLAELQAELARLRPRAALAAALAHAATRHERVGSRLALVHPQRRLAHARDRLEAAWRHVVALAPTRVLERGYALVRDDRGNVVRDPGQVPVGARIEIQLAGGRVTARIEGVG
jgi:exodeoxyribonuclease VII large subunit